MFAPVNIYLMTARSPYHHGDLRNALVKAAADLAEQGGPDAVTIRATARAVGVTPTAAYRHFANQEDLLRAAKQWSLEEMVASMRKRLAVLPVSADPADAATARLEAIGRGYVDFALSEPGLFRTAFCTNPQNQPELESLSDLSGQGDGAYAMLVKVIDDLLELGFFEPELRTGVQISAWAFVHGLASLLTDGPLAKIPREAQQPVIDQAFRAFQHSLWTSRESLRVGGERVPGSGLRSVAVPKEEL